MTPEATWLSLAVALSVIWTAGWVGWRLAWLQAERKLRLLTLSDGALRKLQQMRRGPARSDPERAAKREAQRLNTRNATGKRPCPTCSDVGEVGRCIVEDTWCYGDCGGLVPCPECTTEQPLPDQEDAS